MNKDDLFYNNYDLCQFKISFKGIKINFIAAMIKNIKMINLFL